MKTVTILSPVYNEAEGIGEFNKQLINILKNISGYEFKVLYVADKCSDRTWEELSIISEEHGNVSCLLLSSRYGHQAALTAGMDYANSDVVIMMDSDMQHPPEVIPLLLQEYEKGFEIVYTIRVDQESISFFKKQTSILFYKIMNFFSETKVQSGAADFRLISRDVCQVFKESIKEHNPFYRGLFQWIGFKQTSITFKANERFRGASKYNFKRLVHFAVSGIISFSKKPLRTSIYLGFLIALIGFLFALIMIIYGLSTMSFPPGWLTIVVLLCLFSGTQLISVGVLGEYIALVFDEVRNRPRYVVEKKINI